MSDQQPGPRKPPEDEDVDELPSESVLPGQDAGELSLEEQIAQMTDLEIEDEEKERKKESPGDRVVPASGPEAALSGRP